MQNKKPQYCFYRDLVAVLWCGKKRWSDKRVLFLKRQDPVNNALYMLFVVCLSKSISPLLHYRKNAKLLLSFIMGFWRDYGRKRSALAAGYVSAE